MLIRIILCLLLSLSVYADSYIIIGQPNSAVSPTTISFGYGTGLNDNGSGIDYFYVPQVSAGTEDTFTGAGSVETIKLYNRTSSGRLRIWKGTMSGNDFVFDSYTEVVDISGLSTGWITLTAPTHFTAFTVTSSTVLGFYSNTNNTLGLSMGRGVGVSYQFYGYVKSSPPYSGNLTLGDGTAGRLEMLVTGTGS